MSNPSHAALSRIHAAWQAHKEQMKPQDFGPDRGIEARRIRSLPLLTPEQSAD